MKNGRPYFRYTINIYEDDPYMEAETFNPDYLFWLSILRNERCCYEVEQQTFNTYDIEGWLFLLVWYSDLVIWVYEHNREKLSPTSDIIWKCRLIVGTFRITHAFPEVKHSIGCIKTAQDFTEAFKLVSEHLRAMLTNCYDIKIDFSQVDADLKEIDYRSERRLKLDKFVRMK